MLLKDNTALYHTLSLLGDRHTLLIISELILSGSTSFNDLKRKLIFNPTSLSKKLRYLQAHQIIEIDDTRSNRLYRYYRLTESAQQLQMALMWINDFAQKHFATDTHSVESRVA